MEFRLLRSTTSTPLSNPSPAAQAEISHWIAPPAGWLKINCDGSFRPTSGKAGVGVVIRNHQGILMDGRNGPIEAESALSAEAAAIREGVNLAISQNLQEVIFESDSACVHSDIVSKCRPKFWKIWPIIKEIRDHWKNHPKWQFQLIKRKANAAADWVATHSSHGMCNTDWVTNPHPSLVLIFDKDGVPAPPNSFDSSE